MQSKTHNYKQTPDRISRYTVLCLLAIVLVVGFGVVQLVQSSSAAYQYKGGEKIVSQLHHDIATVETEYYALSKQVSGSNTVHSMVAYSPDSTRLRYARVGGSVYALALNR